MIRHVLLLVLLVMGACHGSKRVEAAPPPPPGLNDAPAPSAPAEGQPVDEAPALLPNGAACLEASACASGLCEGQGCGEDQPGVCVSTQRICTMDLRPYCTCEGETVSGSGSCPNVRYRARGMCSDPAATTELPEGAACLSADQCASGVCEGQGCGDDQPGVCAPALRACTRDLVSYCGCDGQTFRTSGSCPGQRFAAKGTCPTE